MSLQTSLSLAGSYLTRVFLSLHPCIPAARVWAVSALHDKGTARQKLHPLQYAFPVSFSIMADRGSALRPVYVPTYPRRLMSIVVYHRQ